MVTQVQLPAFDFTSITMAPKVAQQSIRSSCDRCRFQKLKCTVSSEAEKCDRCARAKVDCIFGRRARARRLSDVQNATDRTSGDYKNVSDPPRMNQGPLSPITPDSLSECQVNDNALLDSHSRYRGSWSSSQYGGHSSDITIDELGDSIFYGFEALREHQTDHGRNGPDPFNFTMPSTFIDRPESETLSPFGQDGGAPPYYRIRTTQDGEMGRDSPLEDRVSHAIRRLSTLIAEIYDTCGMLKDSPWASMSHPTGLNDYPIGRILHLSHEFTNILQRIAWTTGMRSAPELDPTFPPDRLEPQVPPTAYTSIYGLATPLSASSVIGQTAGLLEAGLHDGGVSTSNSFQPAVEGRGFVDAPAMLLMLSCFISLTKLYGIVFTHFESHLSGLPPASLSSAPAGIGLVRGRGLQLGELPLLDETYSKTYTGVRMLLDTFQSAEDVIGLPDSLSILRGSAHQRTEGELAASRDELKGVSPWTAFQGELALAVLRQDAIIGGNSVQEGFHDLSLKIQSLKRILREKMDL